MALRQFMPWRSRFPLASATAVLMILGGSGAGRAGADRPGAIALPSTAFPPNSSSIAQFPPPPDLGPSFPPVAPPSSPSSFPGTNLPSTNLPSTSLPSTSLPTTRPATNGSLGTPVPNGPRPVTAVKPNCPAANRDLKLTQSSPYESLLKRSWKAYGDRFIQADGKVVDYQAEDQRTTSEGQAYAMLRAVLINDQATFDQTLAWAEANLDRPSDTLWAWHWNAQSGIQDSNFATDADIDAATALIFAARRWNCSGYEALAQQKLNDIWRLSLAEIQGKQFILPGPKAAFANQPDQTVLNPSYFSPYAYRLFAQVDRRQNWSRLVEDGYALLNEISAFSKVGLPADWIAINPKTGQLSELPEGRRIKSLYSFDAYRLWWRVGLDASWFKSPAAEAYLNQNLPYLAQRWKTDQAIPAVLDLDGDAQVDYEATSQYAMLYPAIKLVDREVAFEIFKGKLLGSYSRGLWDNEDAYYSQNLAWFALLPPQGPTELLNP